MNEKSIGISPYVFPGLKEYVLNAILRNEKIIQPIVERVGDYFNISVDKLKSSTRKREAVVPRHICMYILKKKTALTYNFIAGYFGGRNHTAVIHACKTIRELLSYDENLRNQITELMK